MQQGSALPTYDTQIKRGADARYLGQTRFLLLRRHVNSPDCTKCADRGVFALFSAAAFCILSPKSEFSGTVSLKFEGFSAICCLFMIWHDPCFCIIAIPKGKLPFDPRRLLLAAPPPHLIWRSIPDSKGAL